MSKVSPPETSCAAEAGGIATARKATSPPSAALIACLLPCTRQATAPPSKSHPAVPLRSQRRCTYSPTSEGPWMDRGHVAEDPPSRNRRTPGRDQGSGRSGHPIRGVPRVFTKPLGVGKNRPESHVAHPEDVVDEAAETRKLAVKLVPASVRNLVARLQGPTGRRVGGARGSLLTGSHERRQLGGVAGHRAVLGSHAARRHQRQGQQEKGVSGWHRRFSLSKGNGPSLYR